MQIKINCSYNDQGAWCTNKNVKRSLFGIGARCCVEHNDNKCELKEIVAKKGAPPPPPSTTRKCLVTQINTKGLKPGNELIIK